jgi:hypothetical protein
MIDRWQNTEYAKKISEKVANKARQNWKNPEYAQKVLSASGRALNIHPNRSERALLEVIQPFGFEFVGDGRLIIDGKCPDFWNGNHLVELYGDYWHRGDDPQERIDLFKAQGYDCLVVWEHELNDLQVVQERVQAFVGWV